MLTDDERRMMTSLNGRIQLEQDHEKLFRLIEELNRLLHNAELRTQALRRRPASPGPELEDA